MFSSGDLADEVTDTFHVEPMPPITTSFQLSSSSSSLFSPRHAGTGPTGYLSSSLGRRPTVACELTPPCGVVTTASSLHHLRRNSFSATVSNLRRGLSFTTLTAGTDVYKYSFFPRTIRDWNSLDTLSRSRLIPQPPVDISCC